MPTATDLVTDLPADFEVFGQAVDTALMDLKGGTTNQVLAKNSDTDMDFKWVADAAGMTNPMTTTGDTIYSSSGSTPARLGIGTAGQVLQVNSGATAPEWTTPAAGGGMTLLSTTTLSGASTTVSSISGAYKDLLIHVSGMRTAANSYGVHFDPNGSASISSGAKVKSLSTTASAQGFDGATIWVNQTGDYLGSNANNAFTIRVFNYATAEPVKNYSAIMQYVNGSSQVETINLAGGILTTSAITSWATVTDASSFNAGTIKIYGVN